MLSGPCSAVTAVIFLLICWLSTAPKLGQDSDTAKMSSIAAGYMADPHFQQVTDIIEGRCSMCQVGPSLCKQSRGKRHGPHSRIVLAR